MEGDEDLIEYTSVVPADSDYVMQPNLLARASYNLTAIARRVLSVAWGRVKIESVGSMAVEMKVADMLKAMGMGDQGNNYEAIHRACREAMGAFFEIRDSDDSVVDMYHWVRNIKYDRKQQLVQMVFDEDQRPFIAAYQNHVGYHKIRVDDFAKLESRYAQRWYERAMSTRYHAGKKGNDRGTWFFVVGIPDELRSWLKIDPKEYQRTTNLRVKTIDLPIREINEKIAGLHLTADYQYHSRRLVGVKIKCRIKNKGEGRTVSPSTQTEVEDDKWIAINSPGLWEKLLEIAQSQPFETELWMADWSEEKLQEWKEKVVHGKALEALKSHPEAQRPAVRGRPRKKRRGRNDKI